MGTIRRRVRVLRRLSPFFGMIIIVVMVYRCAEPVQQQACHVQRGITLLLKNPKLLIYR
jgi:hypothetical protein